MLSMAYRTLSLIRRTFGSDIPILVKRKLYMSFVKSLFPILFSDMETLPKQRAMHFKHNEVHFYFKAIKSPFCPWTQINALSHPKSTHGQEEPNYNMLIQLPPESIPFFNLFPRLALPINDSSLSMISIKNKLRSYLSSHFMNNFESNSIVLITLYISFSVSLSQMLNLSQTSNFQTL